MLYAAASPHIVVAHATVYTESYAALGITAGMLAYMQSRHAFAILSFAVAVAFRPQAVLTPLALYGVKAWHALSTCRSPPKVVLTHRYCHSRYKNSKK